MINEEPLDFHMMIRQGITWYNLGDRDGNSINENMFYISDK